MRKISTFLFFLVLGFYSFSQCTNSTSYGSATAPSTVGSTATISFCNYQTEYSTVSGLVAGNTYYFDYDLGGCITIHSGSSSGPVVASGNAPVSYTPGSGGTYYIHYNTNCGGCGTATSCGTSTVTLTSSGGGGGGGCVGGSNNSCATADPFCTGTTYNYCNTSGVASMGSYGCLISTPNPMWMYLNIATSGNIDIYMEQFTTSGTPIDVDFALYGPFSSLAAACPISSSTPQVDCSFSAAPTETGFITGAIAGQWYMLLITNYNGALGYIEFSQTGGSGATNCTIVTPCPVTAASNSPLCAGQTLNLTATNVTGGTYSWSGPGGYTSSSQNPTRTNVSTAMAGTYTVTVTAPGPCTSTSSVTVTINPLPTVTVSPSSITVCNGYPVSLVAGGANTYSWSPSTGLSSTTGSPVTATPTSTTTYTVTGTNTATGCINTATSTITVNPALTVTVTPSSPSICSGNSVSLTASGASTYSWSPATGLSSTTGATVSANPSATQTYTVTGSATNCNNASTTVTVTVNSTASGFTYNGNQCLSTNSFNFNNTGAMGGGVTYSWTFPGGSPGTSNTASPSGVIWSAAGTYTVSQTVTSGGCPSTTTQNIIVYPLPTVTASGTNPLCSLACTGSVSAAGAGGTPGYNYTWSGTLGTGTPKTGICAGTYNVTVSDANGCTGTNSVTITNPSSITGTVTVTNTTCNGVCSGTLSVSASGGALPYSYSWSGSLGSGATVSSVCAGSYTVTITDANGCMATSSGTVNQPTVLNATATSTNTNCNGSCTGTLTASASGGTPGYTYNWGGSLGTGATKTGLCAGTYVVTVTDANGCTKTASTTVNQPAVLTVSPTSTPASCNLGCNGTVSASAVGGTSAYSYSWSNSLGTGTTKTGLCAGTYSVTVTDAAGCTATGSTSVTQPVALSVSATSGPASCDGICNGTLSATGSGGTSAYTFSWSSGLGTGPSKTGVCAGTYTVTITDANNCTTTTTATVTQPAVLSAGATGTNPSCNGVCDGTLTGSAVGGTSPYTFSWSGGLTPGATKTGICAGSYTLTVTDANGCTKTANVSISAPAGLTATASSTAASCNGGCNGTLNASASGGTTAYSYTWSNSLGTGATVTGVCAGTYFVTVTDGSGCTTTASATVAQPTSLSATATGTNVNCTGGNNGSATVSASGATGPYTYLWGNSATTATISGLAAGTYSVTVTDANACTVVSNYTVTQPSALTATANGTNASCNAVCDGTASTTPAGGTSPYSYSWGAGSGFQTTQTATGLCNGSYTVTITDSKGCNATASYTVSQPSAISLTPSSTAASCGNSNGTASVIASGGTSPYSYLWCNSQTTNAATGLPAGGCTVTVTDANGCSSSAVATVNSLGGPSVTIASFTDVTCNGGNNGTATASATGGASPYSYSWSPSGGTGAAATGLSAGTFTVNVTDNSGCIASQSVVISQPPALTSSITSSSQVSCFGLCDGSATVSVSGGSTGYTYSWPSAAGSQVTSTATGLCAGSFTVTATDSKNCTTTSIATISQPALLTSSAVPTDVLCNSGCNGSINLTTSGGVSPFTYFWNNSATSEDINGLCAGNFDVTVTDANSCTSVAFVSVSEPSVITLTTTSTNATCGSSNGTATVSAAGGNSGYTYLWGNAQTNATVTGVAAGSYSVTVTDLSGCSQTTVATVNNASAPTVSITTLFNVSCFGGNNGSAQASPSGGVSPYTYIWSASGSTSAVISGLSAGNYTVTVTDANGCSSSSGVVITQPGVLGAVISASANATCFDSCNGSATINASGGVSPFSYFWQNGGTTVTKTGLCAETIYVTVTDANGCGTTSNVIITEPSPVTASVSATNIICNGNCDGQADLNVSGGTAPYTYLWSNSSTTEDLSSLCSGVFDVSITDINGCTGTSSVTIGEPTLVVLTGSSTNATCGQNNGQACISASGGTSGYTYEWSSSPVQTSACASGLIAGNYTVTVTDGNGCIFTESVIVNNASGGAASASVLSNTTGAGVCNGSASAAMTGGTSPYSFSWSTSPVQVSATATGLCAGNYCVTVTDGNGCSSTDCLTISEPSSINATSTGINVTCFGDCDGSADLSVSGGISPYSFLWSNGATAEDISNLCAGNYTVTITDANSNSTTNTVVISSPGAITASSSAGNILCNGSCTGTVTAGISGGTEPYNFLWGSGQTTANLNGICAGTYALTVTDFFGCTDVTSATVTQPASMSLSTTSISASCGTSNGSATVSPSGGQSPYSYSWSAGSITSTQSGVSAGTYTVTVTDNNNCQASTAVVVNNNDAGIPSAVIDNNVLCNGQNNGQATATISGGTSPYTYKWSTSPIQTSSSATGLSAGTYSITISDANCETVTSITITEPSVITAGSASTGAGCFGSCNGSTSVTASGGNSPYSYQWNDLNFQTTATATGLCANSYSVTVTDANGCTLSSSAVVIEKPDIVLNSSSTQSTCNQSDGSATITISSGVSPFSYQWDSNAGSQINSTATGLPAGCYGISVTDGNSCIKVSNVCITDAGAPAVSVLTKTDVSCNNGCDGFAQISVSGGNPPYVYSWNSTPAQNTASAFNLCAGTYTGSMVDSTGCTASVSVTINQPALLSGIVSAKSDVSCNGLCNGSVNTVVSGGSTPYSYLWNDPNSQSSSSATGLCPGSYSLLISDGNSCDTTVNVIISQPNALSGTVSTTNSVCGGPSGSACVGITGGTGSYSYLWDDVQGQTGSCSSALLPGTYSVTVTDANSCSLALTANVSVIPAGNASVSGIVDASCSGSCDGQATVSMSGTGTSPYSYQWSSSATNQTTSTATGLCAGNHDVTITDANGCVATVSAIINNPAPLTISSIQSNDVNCYGVCNGSALANVSGGAGSYSYQWNDPLSQISKSATGLCAGTYSVAITDANNCTVSDSVTISQPPELILNTSSIDANCSQSNGSGCVIASGGTTPYSYLWQNGNISPCASALSSGTYSVTVNDGNGCSDLALVQIQNINGPVAQILSQVNIDCKNNCNGSATASVTNGILPYSFQWSASANNQITPTASNLCGGMHTVTITDSAGCTTSVTVNINEPAEISFSQQITEPKCFGDCNGTAWVVVSGGTSPYAYQWSNTQSNDTAVSLCAGNYMLTISDANNCTEVLSYDLTNPAQITTSLATVAVSCNGICDGKATVSSSNGTAPFFYQWNDPDAQTSQQANGLCAGNFSVTITDANGCKGYSSGTVNQPSLLTAVINNSGNVSCPGQCNGYAQVSVSGGTPSYTYSWNNSSISQVNSNLCAGTYAVTVKDANNCTQVATINIVEPANFTATIQGTDVACGGNCDGQAVLYPTGGTAPYTYLWDAGTSFQTSSSATGLCGGNYSVTISDFIGCKIYKNVNIFEPNPLGVAITGSDANCGQNNGSICVNVLGGSAPYTYQWNDPNTQTSGCASGLYAGCYTINIIDAAGCVADSLVCINDIAGPAIAIDTFSNVSCAGLNNGNINFNVTGGVLPYTLEWYDNNGNLLPAYSGSTVANFTLGSGTYYLVATDDAGCITSFSQGITAPNPITSAVWTSANASCNGSCDGSATVLVAGGVAPLTYIWTNGQTSLAATGLCAGNSMLTITDANQCTKTQAVQITEPAAISAVNTSTQASCYGNCDGGIVLTVTGGTVPYQYLWTTGSTNADQTNLCSGNYAVTIYDSHNCTFTYSATVSDPALLSVNIQTVSTTCSSCNGQASVQAAGGNPPYVYIWGTGEQTSGISNICSGTSNVTVTDLRGCSLDTAVAISDQPGPQITGFTVIDPACYGMNNGSATVNYSGGTGNINFAWSGGQTTQTIVGLAPGTYQAIIEDGNSCTDTLKVIIGSPTEVIAAGNGSDTICFGESTQFWAGGSGGTPASGSNPYSVQWTGNASNLTGIGPHIVSPTSNSTFPFTIFDANNCSASGVIQIVVKDELVLQLSTGNPLILCDGDSANICAEAQGGDGNGYFYQWSDGFMDSSLTSSCHVVNPLDSTTYSIIVSDGCSLNDTVWAQVNVNPVPQAYFSAFNPSGCPPLQLSFSSPNLPGLTYTWDFNEDGVIDSDTAIPTFIFTQSGFYDVTLTVFSAGGCFATVTDSAYVTVFPAPAAGFTVSDTIASVLNSDIDFDANGFTTGADSVFWNWGDYSSDIGMTFTHLYKDTGTYVVTLTAKNLYGCLDDTTVIIKIIDDFVIFVPNAFTPNKDGSNDGFIPKGVGIDPEKFKMWIFDRWGDIIFETNNINTPWDGTAHGGSKPVQIGVYIWMVETVDEKGEPVKKMGHVTVYR